MEYLKKFIQTEVNDTEVANTEFNDKEVKTNNICPLCGEDLVKRVAKTGYRAGKEFWGCSSFPKCRYIENID